MEVYVAEIKGNKINLSLTDPNEFQESVAEDLDTANVDYQWSDMMVALQTAGIEVTVPADEAAAPAEEPAKEEAAPAEAAPAEAVAEEAPAAEIKISAKDVKVLREATGAGMMDCKKALKANGGDIDAATDFLRKKGLAQADKKAGRIASEGAVATYVHAGSRIGVMIEVNCETDFVARGDTFKDLCKDLAMQVAACPQVDYVSPSDIDPAFLEKEREIEMGKEDIQSKPEAIRPKIVQG